MPQLSCDAAQAETALQHRRTAFDVAALMVGSLSSGSKMQNRDEITQVVREFLSCLTAEELIFHPRLVDDAYGLAFLTAIKEFDHYYYNLVRHDTTETAYEPLLW